MRRLKRAERSRVENLKQDAEAGRRARPADVLFLVGLLEGGREVPQVGAETSPGGGNRKVLITRPDGSQMLEEAGQGRPHREEAPRYQTAFNREEETDPTALEMGRTVEVLGGDHRGARGKINYLNRGGNRAGVFNDEAPWSAVIPMDLLRVVPPEEAQE